MADYASIKNGSYAKLMKAYYGKENNANPNRSFRHNEERQRFTDGDREESTGHVETATDELKESADTLFITGKTDLSA